MNKRADLSAPLKKTNGYICVGANCKTKVNALVGNSINSDNTNNIDLIRSFERMDNPPDIVTDLSIFCNPKDIPIWKRVVCDSPFVSSTVPVYLAKWYRENLDAKNLLEIAIEQMEGGVGLITIHPTPTLELISLSKKRFIPCTSRGGGMVVRDLMKKNHSSENVYMAIMDDLIKNAKRTNTVLSIGTTYRPGCIFDSLDETHVNEILIQISLAKMIRNEGVHAIIEGPGHCRSTDINKVSEMLFDSLCPIMTLGPIPIDSAVGFDHIAATIGATIMGLNGCAHILSAVTREEHPEHYFNN
jgi:phosphomethylpyrimidine synthase